MTVMPRHVRDREWAKLYVKIFETQDGRLLMKINSTEVTKLSAHMRPNIEATNTTAVTINNQISKTLQQSLILNQHNISNDLRTNMRRLCSKTPIINQKEKKSKSAIFEITACEDASFVRPTAFLLWTSRFGSPTSLPPEPTASPSTSPSHPHLSSSLPSSGFFSAGGYRGPVSEAIPIGVSTSPVSFHSITASPSTSPSSSPSSSPSPIAEDLRSARRKGKSGGLYLAADTVSTRV